jgi:hypothetical protein
MDVMTWQMLFGETIPQFVGNGDDACNFSRFIISEKIFVEEDLYGAHLKILKWSQVMLITVFKISSRYIKNCGLWMNAKKELQD